MSMKHLPWLLIVGGLIWIGAEWHEDRGHARRHVVPAEADLQSVTGKAVAARVVDLKREHNVVENHYVELDIQGEQGTKTVRIGEPHPDSSVDGLSGVVVTAKFDPADEDRVYSLGTADREIIAFQRSVDYKKRLVDSNSGGYTMGWLAIGFGIVILWFSRKPAT